MLFKTRSASVYGIEVYLVDVEVKHAKIRVGDSALGIGEAHDRWQTKATVIYVYVEECDAVYQQALKAGVKSIFEPKDQPYGDRQGAVEDEWANQWFYLHSVPR